MNNLTRILLTTASVTALVISAQNTARADSSVGGGTVYYGAGGAPFDATSVGGGFGLYTAPNDTVTVDTVTIDKTVTAAIALAEGHGGPVNPLDFTDNNGGTDSLTVNFNGTGSNLTESSADRSAALLVDNTGTGLTTLDTTGTSSGSTFTGTQGIAVLGGGNVSITTKSGDQIISNNYGTGFASATSTGGYGNGYTAGIYASGGGSGDAITLINNATITTDGSGHYFDAGISVANAANATITNNGDVAGKWAGVLGESTAGNVIVNNNGTISSESYGVVQLGSGTLTVHNYGTGVIQATNDAGEGIGILSQTNTAVNVTNDAGGFIVGTHYGIIGKNTADSITNAGTIAAGTYSAGNVTLGAGPAAGTAIYLNDGGTVVNKAGGVIEGGEGGVFSIGSATIHNAGHISAGNESAIFLGASNNVLTNDSAGTIVGGSSGDGVLVGLGSPVANTTINNYGSISGGAAGITALAASNVTINLYAGSTTGGINLASDGNGSVVALYTGMGTNNTGLTDSSTGAVEQANGTLAAAAYNNIVGGSGDTLELRGGGDGTGLNGVAGQIDLSSTPNGTGVITGFAGIDKLDSGKWVFNNAGGDAANRTLSIALNAGTIDATAVGAFGSGTIQVFGASTIEFSANGTYDNDIALDIGVPSATNAFTFSADTGVTATLGVIPSSGSAGQSIVINGAGTVVLGSTETYTGTTTIAAGTLSLGGGGNISASSNVNIIGGTLDVSAETATPTINNLSGGGSVKFGAQGITVNSNNGTTEFSGVINQTATGGLFTKTGNGTLELGGTNTYTVGTVIANGTLELATANAIAASAFVNLTSANSVLDATGVPTGSHAVVKNLTGVSGSQVKFGGKGLTVNETGSTTFAGTISGSGSSINPFTNVTTYTPFTIEGGGNLTLRGHNTYTANTVVTDNTTLSLGGNGTLASGANVTVNGNSRLYMDGLSSVQTFGTVVLGDGTGAGALFVGEAAHATIANLNMTGGTVFTHGEGRTLLTVESLSGDANSTITLEGTTMNLGANGTASTYSGTIDLGTYFGSPGILNAGILTFNGTLTAQEGGTFTATTFNQTGGTVTLAGGEAGSVANVTTYNLSNGTLTVYGGESGNGNLTAATFNQTGGTVEVGEGSHGGVLNATTYVLSNGNLTIDGGEDGAGTLTATTFNQTGGAVTIKSGEYGGTLTAATYNQSAGNITISSTGEGTATLSATTFNQTGGNVAVNYDGLLSVGTLTGANGTITIGEGGEVVAGIGNVSSTYGGDISSAASGDGYFIKQGTGTLTLSGNNSNYTGFIGIDAGVLQAGSTTAFGGAYVRLDPGTTLDLAGYDNAIFSLHGNGTVTDSSTTADTLELYQGGDFEGVIQDGAGKTSLTLDAGELYLSGVNTYSGTTTIAHGAALYLADGGSIANSSVADDGTLDVSDNNLVGSSSIRSLSGNGTVSMGSGTLIITNANGTFSGTLQDGGQSGGTGASLEIAGGREVLSGTNTYTGGTTIDAGAVLQLGAGGATGSVAGPLTDNGTLAYDVSTPTTISSAISGNGALEVDLSTVTITAAQSTLAGASLIAPNATLALSGAGTLDVPLTDNGTFDISAASSGRAIQSLAGNGTVKLGANTLTLSTANGTFSGVIGGAGGLTLTGGKETLSGVNTYTGATAISANTTLALSGTGSVADSSGVADAGTFDISATTDGATIKALTGDGSVVLGNQTLTIADASGTFSGVASGTGGLTIAGGTETLSGTNTYTGATTIGANATLALSGSGGVPDSTITDNGTFDISGTTNGTKISSLNGNGSVFLGSQTLTFVNADGAFSGDITDGGDDGSVVIASGTQTLTGDNTYGGGTTVDAGSTLIVNSPEALGTGTITFGPNSTIEFTTNTTFTQNAVFEADAPIYDVGSSTVTWSGAMSGAGDLAVTGNGGTLVLTNTANSYTGGTEVYGGSTLEIGADSELGGVAPLQLGNATTAGTLEAADSFNLAAGRAVTLNAGGGTIDTQAFNMTIAHAIDGSGGLTKDGSGKLTLTGANTYTGGTTIAKGTLQIGNAGTTGSVAGNIADDGALVFDRSNALTYAGVISGNGTLAQSGSGTLTLTGTNTVTGATSVDAGTLQVNGSLSSSAVAVNNGGTLGGTGKVGGTTVASGGTLAPGVGGAGTLSVVGNLTLASGSATDIDVTPTAADKIAVSGTAKLGGTLAISAGAGTYTAGTDYTLVSASGMSGTFSSVTGGVTGFDSTIVYDPTTVMLDLTAAGGGTTVVTYDFSAYGVTPNEIAAGTALEAAAPSGSLYKAVGTAVAGDPATAPGKLNQLTGEIHASARSALIEDGRAIRDSVLDHLAQDPDGMTVWATGFTGNGRIDATGNTGALHHSNSGFIAGVDTPISGWSPDLRLGLAGAYNADHGSISGLGSNLHGSTGHIVAYAGWTGGPWAAKAGVDLGWGNMHVTRDVSFLTETEHSSQSTRTTQEFGDVGYNIPLDGAALQPYFDLAHIDAKTGGFTEAGGLAALNGDGASNDVTYSTLGGRVSLNPWAMGSWCVTPRLDIGWQHAFSRVNPYDAVTFNDNSQSFAVAGAPLDKDAAAVQGGFDITLTPQAVISLAYDGTFSSKVKDNTFRGGLIWKF